MEEEVQAKVIENIRIHYVRITLAVLIQRELTNLHIAIEGTRGRALWEKRKNDILIRTARSNFRPSCAEPGRVSS